MVSQQHTTGELKNCDYCVRVIDFKNIIQDNVWRKEWLMMKKLAKKKTNVGSNFDTNKQLALLNIITD